MRIKKCAERIRQEPEATEKSLEQLRDVALTVQTLAEFEQTLAERHEAER